MGDTKTVRSQLQRYYALTDQLNVQLQALDNTVPSIRVEIRQAPPAGDIDSENLEALAFLVLIEAGKSAREDLRAIMDQVEKITTQKRKVRAALKQRPDDGLDLFSASSVISAVTTKAELSRAVEEMKHDLDAMTDLGEMESLRLQMAMDRLSKMMSTLSNLLKKMSDTASQITQNLK